MRKFLLLVFLLVGCWAIQAQGIPFQAEVVVQTARLRWGPGLTYSVQHYANLSHILTILAVDTTADSPWTWYQVQTPSGVMSWIRSDLVRRQSNIQPVGIASVSTAIPEQQVDSNQGGLYPIVADNLCNTSLFRPCRNGADIALWETGYWAKDRYDTWERQGRNLQFAFYLNACRTMQLCQSWQAWELGRSAAEQAYGPQVIASVVKEASSKSKEKSSDKHDPIKVTWLGLSELDAKRLMRRSDLGGIVDLFYPPAEIRATSDLTSTLIGKFEYAKREGIVLTCQFWHNAGQLVKTDFVLVKAVSIGRDFDQPEKVTCLSGNVAESDVVARRWHIQITRSYSGKGVIRNVKWKLSGTYGNEPTSACVDDPCIKTLQPALHTYLEEHGAFSRENPPSGSPGFIVAAQATCTGTYHERDRTPGREITDYRHRCQYMAEGFDLTLEFDFTHDKRQEFLEVTM